MKGGEKLFLILFLFLLVLSSNVKSQLLINEIMATNASYQYETDYYNYSDWIELYNNSDNNVQLALFYVSDDKLIPDKWQLPVKTLAAKNYIVFYCDKEANFYHTNFGLDSDGETLYLLNSDGIIIDSVLFGKQYPNISFGRNPNSLQQWMFCATPTLASQNVVSTAIKPSPKAQFSILAGRTIASSVSLTGDEIRYTTDGSEPTESSDKYSTSVNLSSTTVLKTKTYAQGYLPSEPRANTYFKNEHNFTLPVVSISTDEEYLYDNTIGIYVEGTNGIIDNCRDYPINWNQPWERAAYFEYFDENGIQQISQPVGIKVSGGCSRNFEQKSISVYARGKYGNNDFDYPFFSEKPEIRRFKSLFLRNSGNDFNRTQLRDAFFHALYNKSLDIDYQGYKPASYYMNGEYWGIINIREKINESYVIQNYGLEKDSFDLLVLGLRASESEHMSSMQGSVEDYYTLYDYIKTHDLSIGSNYDYVSSKIDMREYINYLAFQIYIANTDWPGNNVKIWREIPDGKWRWIIFDTDFAFTATSYDHNTIYFASEDNPSINWPNPPHSTLFFRKLLENENFKNEFIRTILTLRNTIFQPDWCNHVLDSLSNAISTEISYHKDRYGGTVSDWNYRLNQIKNFAEDRYNFIPDYVKSYFGISGEEVNVNINNSGTGKGSVWINSSRINNYPFSYTTIKDIALTLEAKPEKGFRFNHWKTTRIINSEDIISFNDEWRYLDEAADYPVNWNSPSFDDSSWSSGMARLGYGETNLNTTLSYGSDPNNKITTALFRKKFNVADTSVILNLRLALDIDDGVIAYFNGVEVSRSNMPTGTVTFNTFASIATEPTLVYFDLDKSVLKQGENVIACEVHQGSANSSDLVYDLRLYYTFSEVAEQTFFSEDHLIEFDTSFNISLEPVFEPVEPVSGIFLNELATATKLFVDEKGEKTDFIEIYNSNIDNLELNGFYLSDDTLNLMRYAIPENLMINRESFLIFYADGEAVEGDMHTSFRLGENGETVILSQKVGNEMHIIDSITFEFLIDKASYGKFEDGTGEWYHMMNITPGLPNDSTRFFVDVNYPELSYNINVYPNPTKGDAYVSIKEGNVVNQNLMLNIYDITGKPVLSDVWLNSLNNYINLNQISKGIYLLRITNNGNILYNNKIMITR